MLFVVLTFVNLGARGLYDVAAAHRAARRALADRRGDVDERDPRRRPRACWPNSVGGASTQAVRLWLWATILLGTGRLVIAAIVRRRQRRGHDQLATLIIGADAVGRRIARRLVDQPDLGLRPVGFIDEGLVPRQDRDGDEAPVLGSTADLEAIVAGHGVQHVIVGFAAAPPDS